MIVTCPKASDGMRDRRITQVSVEFVRQHRCLSCRLWTKPAKGIQGKGSDLQLAGDADWAYPVAVCALTSKYVSISSSLQFVGKTYDGGRLTTGHFGGGIFDPLRLCEECANEGRVTSRKN